MYVSSIVITVTAPTTIIIIIK